MKRKTQLPKPVLINDGRFEERVKNLTNKKKLTRSEAETAVRTVIREKEGGPVIRATSDGKAYFEQADIRFSVDPRDLNNVVGSNGGDNVIDKMMDSQVASLAIASGLPVSPFARELLRPVLTGVVQLTWYRDLENYTSAHLEENQEKRVELYKRLLSSYKAEPEPSSEGSKRIRKANPARFTRRFKALPGFDKGKLDAGRERALYDVLKGLKQTSNFADIVKASTGKVETKQPLEKIVDRFLGKLLAKGAITAE